MYVYIYCYITSHMYDHVPKMMIICTFHSIVHGTPTAKNKMLAPSQSRGKWRPNGKYKYGGGVVADDGTIYCFPSDVES